MRSREHRRLVAAVIRDLISDARTSTGAYRESCRRQIGELFRRRHFVKFDDYGWPIWEPQK